LHLLKKKKKKRKGKKEAILMHVSEKRPYKRKG
jgi:hypothetical protein